jgi:plasmid stability protein
VPALKEEIVRELQLRVAQHGCSAEAKHREILRQALLPQKANRSLKNFLLAMPAEGDDADFTRGPDHG